MTASIEIVTYSDTLDMYGEPDRNAAYSLSGHVAVSLSSTSSFFERRRTVHLLLRSLVITFEGQSELVAEETGYSALRLCSVSQELSPGEPVELSNEGHEETDKPCTWNVVFNLTIPGWLPPTALFGDSTGGESGTRYALHAAAKFEHAEENSSKSWFSAFCTPFQFPIRVVKAKKHPIHLNRLVCLPSFASTSTSQFPSTNFTVCAEPERSDVETDKAQIPRHILSALRVVATVPDRVGTDEESLPFTLRLRTEGLPEDDCKRLRFTEFAVDLEQTERYRTASLPAYVAQFPVPPSKEQPPHKPLLSPHSLQALYDLGLASHSPPRHVLTRSFSLLPEDISGRYKLASDGYIFAQDADTTQAPSWFSMKTQVPFLSVTDSTGDHVSWKNERRIRESGQSPLFGVHHRLYVTLMCTYDLTEGENPERATERLNFYLPLRFVRVAPPPPSPSVSRSTTPTPSIHGSGRCTPSMDSASRSSSTYELPLPSMPYAQSLPAYSQLFYANGDRKIDYSIPLPLYTPHPTKNVDTTDDPDA